MVSADTIHTLYERFLAHPEVSTDTRRIEPGSIFFALRGASFDGNRFAAEALGKGASCVVVDDPEVIPADDPEKLPPAGLSGANRETTGESRYILVENVLETLQQLAARHRQALGIPILAVTGSNGKTTTKELLARVLAKKFNVYVTQGNLNNHIGVPLTLLAMPAGTELGVVEMGANAPGEIAALCRIAQPDYGLITNVGRAHLEGFGDEEGVKRAKGELYDYLAEHGGLAFFREDDPVLSGMIAARPTLRTSAYDMTRGDFPSRLEGVYNRANVAAAAAAGRYFGVPEDRIAAAIAGYVPENHRSQRTETARNTLIADCYNANPSSMAAALDNLRESRSPTPKTVILGDMLELGAWTREEHERVVRQLAGMRLDGIYLVGPHFAQAVQALAGGSRTTDTTSAACIGGTTFHTFPDREALAAYLAAHPVAGRLILLKGSRGVGLEKIAELL